MGPSIIDSDQAVALSNSSQLFAELTGSGVDISEIDRIELSLNGVLQETVQPGALVDGPLGQSFTTTLAGLETQQDAVNDITAEVFFTDGTSAGLADIDVASAGAADQITQDADVTRIVLGSNTRQIDTRPLGAMQVDLIGNNFDNTVTAPMSGGQFQLFAGNDTVFLGSVGGTPDRVIDGGDGRDRVVYDSPFDPALVNQSGAVTKVGTNTDSLTQIEEVWFSDFVYDVETQTTTLRNAAPGVTGSDTVTVAENTSGTVATVADPDGDDITIVLQGPDAAFFEVAAESNEIVLSAPLDFEEPADRNRDNVYIFEVVASDGDVSDTTEIAVTVANEDDDVAPDPDPVVPPTATTDVLTTDEDRAVSLDVLDNDISGSGGPLSVVSVNGRASDVGQTVILASGATVLLSANGALQYDPRGAFDDLDPSREAIDSFEYTIDDGSEQDTGRVSVTIAGLVDELSGTSEKDELTGTNGADIIQALGGDDRIEGAGGDDEIDGGDGIDTAVWGGNIGDYVLSIGSLTITEKGAGGASDSVENVELLEFADGFELGAEGALDFRLIEGVQDISAEALTSIVELYAAYFNRAPDALGVLYWGTRIADGMTLPEIAASFFVQDETLAAFPDPDDNEALVDAAYANVLERTPDPEGQAYWIGELESNNVNRAEFMLAIINGAKAETGSAQDVRTIEDKADIGISYAVINGLTDLENASAAMEVYDDRDREASLSDVQQLTAGFREDAVSATSDEIVIELTGVVDDPFAVT